DFPREEGAVRRLLRGRLLASPVGLPLWNRDDGTAARGWMVRPDARPGGEDVAPAGGADLPLLGPVPPGDRRPALSTDRLRGVPPRAAVRAGGAALLAVDGGPVEGAGPFAGDGRLDRRRALRGRAARPAHLVDLGSAHRHSALGVHRSDRARLRLPALQ